MPALGHAEETLVEPNRPLTAASLGRLPQLDSLRGVAAVLVVFHHFQLMYGSAGSTAVNLAPHGSVPLFFLLSGFVLAIPYLKGKQAGYGTFFIRRVIRIYCPYLCALAISVAGATLLHRHLGLGGWADRTWSRPVSGTLVLQHVFLLGNYDSAQYNTAFWSLVQEMRISLVFPALFFMVQKLGLWRALFAALLFSLAEQWLVLVRPGMEHTFVTLRYVSVFICGILLATHLGSLKAWYQKLSPLALKLLWLCSFALFSDGHLFQESGIRGMWHLAEWPTVIGAVGVLLISLNSPGAEKILNSPVPRFVGRISYGLYLIHGTVLFSLAILLHGRVPLVVEFVVYLALTVLAATGFYLAIDEPVIRLGRVVGDRLRARSIAHIEGYRPAHPFFHSRASARRSHAPRQISAHGSRDLAAGDERRVSSRL